MDRRETTANEATAYQLIINTPETIDGVANGGNTTISSGTETYGWTETTNIRMETVVLTMDFSHSWVSDIDISIISPSGTVISVINDVGGSAYYNGEWQYTITGFWGEASAGDWQVTLTDDFPSDDFLVRGLSFEAFGNADTTDDTYFFTQELSQYSGDTSRNLTLGDTDGGTDWINAAAVATDTIIDLNNNGTSVIDGVNLTTVSNNIDNAVTGDGNDDITGNWRANILSGMRGDDHLSAGSGHDTLLGGAGDDIMLADFGDDLMDGGDGIDLVDYSKFGSALTISMLDEDARFISSSAGTDQLISIENLIGSRAADNIVGSQVDNHINGNSGNDIISAQRGNDTVLGGDGSDQLRGNKGDDVLDGQMGRDVLVGGDGADTFVFSDLAHTVVGGHRDRIVDFAQGTDIIDLSALDAIAGGADDAFIFIANQTFGSFGAAGALRFVFQGVKTLIEGDVDGDHVRDFQIEMIGNFTLTESDFLL